MNIRQMTIINIFLFQSVQIFMESKLFHKLIVLWFEWGLWLEVDRIWRVCNQILAIFVLRSEKLKFFNRKNNQTETNKLKSNGFISFSIPLILNRILKSHVTPPTPGFLLSPPLIPSEHNLCLISNRKLFF